MKARTFRDMLAAIRQTGMTNAEIAERIGMGIHALVWAARKGPNTEVAEAVERIYRRIPEPEPVRMVPRFHERCVPRWGR